MTILPTQNIQIFETVSNICTLIPSNIKILDSNLRRNIKSKYIIVVIIKTFNKRRLY